MGDAEQLRLQRDAALEKIKQANRKLQDHVASDRGRNAQRSHATVKEQFDVYEQLHIRLVHKLKATMDDEPHKTNFENAIAQMETANNLYDGFLEQQAILEAAEERTREIDRQARQKVSNSKKAKDKVVAQMTELMAIMGMHMGQLVQEADVDKRALAVEVVSLEETMQKIREAVEQAADDLTDEDCHALYQRRAEVDLEFRKGVWKLRQALGDQIEAATPRSGSRQSSPGRRDTYRQKRLDFPKFQGEIRDFNSFCRDFQDLVVDTKLYDKKAMSHIIRSECLSGEAKKLVQGIHDYDLIWTKLRDKYDDQGEVIEQISLQISGLKKVDEEDYDGLVKFVDVIERAELDMKATNSASVLNNPLTVRLILSKCPRTVKEGLAKELASAKAEEEFDTMLKFLIDRRREATRLARLREDRPRNQSRKGAAHTTNMRDGNSRNQPAHKGNNSGFKCPVNDCVFSKFHFLSGCRAFKKLPVNERGRVVLLNNLCTICFTGGHDSSTCPKKAAGWRTCDETGCGRWHSRLLHGATTPGLNLSINAREISGGVDAALLLVQAVPAHQGEATVLWDTGSTVSLVRHEYAEAAGLRGVDCQFELQGVGNSRTEYDTKMFLIPLISRSGEVVNIHAFGIKSITTDLEPAKMSKIAQMFGLKNNDLRRPSGTVDILIGMDHAELLPLQIKSADRLVLYRSRFGTGYLVGGVADSKTGGQLVHLAHRVCHAGGRAIRHIDFLSAESFGVDVPRRCRNCRGCKECSFKAHQLTYTEARELQEIEEGLSLDTTRRKWTARYPYYSDPCVLENNLSQAAACLHSLERRLVKHGQMDNFNAQFKDAVERGVFKEIRLPDDYAGPVNYVTLTEAYKEGENVTTPLRICMNSSMRYRGVSLNDLMLKGPSSLNNIFSVLLNFWTYPVGVVKDIRKFYQSVDACERDKHLRRVLWRYGDTDASFKMFTTETINFGDRAAGCVAMTCVRQTADLYQNVDPDAAEKLKSDIYVDDVSSGADTRKEAERLSSNMEKIVGYGGFEFKTTTMSGDESESMKVLGTGWDPPTDELFLEVKINTGKKMKGSKEVPNIEFDQVVQLFPQDLTKRIVWRIVLSQFDLLGLASIFFIRLKLLMRELSGEEGRKYEWDEVLPGGYREKFVGLIRLVGDVRKLRFPRSICPVERSAADPELLIFGDGSMQAFCALAYIRWELQDGSYWCVLVSGKTRVAPLKKISIPRLELLGAVAAVRLAASVQESVRFKFQKKYFFTDSTAVFGMIRGESAALQEFVGTRVGEIKSKSDPPSEWYWIPTGENLADLGTREDVVPEMMGPDSSYINGMPWMREDVKEWPISQQPGGKIPEEEICSRAKLSLMARADPPWIKLDKFSSFLRAERVLISVLTAVFKFRRLEVPGENSLRQQAQWILLREAQADLWEDYRSGKLISLLPRKEQVQILSSKVDLLVTEGRSGGVMQVGYDCVFLPILPHGHIVSKLLMGDAHREEHCGVDRTVQRSRKVAWIIRGRRLAKTVVGGCYECRRRRKVLEGQRIAPFPSSRLPPSPPFYSTALDLFGPLEVRDTVKRRTTKKVWGVIFVCTVVGAVHLEVSEDYSTDSFLQCLTRFIHLRGTPRRIQSDPGTQLVAAAKQVGTWDFSKLTEWASGAKTEWHFVPADSQHYNGCAESMIKSTKNQLTACLKEKTFTKGELDTVLSGIAVIINSRPLGKFAGDDVLAGGPITPLHLLSGRASINTPRVEVTEDATLARRIQFIEDTTQQFWDKWFCRVFHHLVPNYRWSVERRNVQVGDVVLLKESNQLKGEYRLARVTEAKPGADGRVRRILLSYKLLGNSKSPQEAQKDLKRAQFRTTERSVQNIVVIVPADESD